MPITYIVSYMILALQHKNCRRHLIRKNTDVRRNFALAKEYLQGWLRGIGHCLQYFAHLTVLFVLVSAYKFS